MEILPIKDILYTFNQERTSQYLSLLSQLTNVFSSELEKRIMIQNFYLKLRDLDDNINIFVIIDNTNNKIIASGTVIIEQKIIHNFGKVGHIEDIVVSYEYRGQGIGKKLIEHLFEFCKKNKCYKILLDCNNENVKFYKKCIQENMTFKKQNNLSFYL